jgi:hypothetical protein
MIPGAASWPFRDSALAKTFNDLWASNAAFLESFRSVRRDVYPARLGCQLLNYSSGGIGGQLKRHNVAGP